MMVNFIWVLNDGTTFTEPVVSLAGVTREFTGIHTCTGTNTFYDNTQGTDSADLDLDVQYGPEISFDQPEVVCKEGESVSLQCTVDANPAPYDVHWMSGGQRIYDGTTYSLPSADRSDGVTLVCMAHNRFYDNSTAMGQEILDLVVQHPPTVSTLPSAAIKEGANVTLNCTVVEANPMMVNFTWVLNDGTTFTEAVVPLAGVTREFTGIHTCTGTNTFYDNTQGTGSADLDLDVQYGPEISFDTKEVICKEGESVTLQCTVDANPAPYDVHWMSGGQRIYDGTTYPLASANRSDEGTLVCMAHNRFYDNSTAMGQESLELFVQYPPMVSTLPSAAIKEGANVTLNCTVVEANPMNVSFTWTLNDGTTFTEPVVPLAGVTREFTGIHTCTGTNTFYDNTQGIGSADLDLDVQYGPEISFDSDVLRVKEGEFVTLECSVDANPAAYDVHWMRDGQRIYDGASYPLGNAGRNDAGTFVCMAHNRFYDNSTAMGQKSLELVVEYPSTVTIALGQATVTKGSDLEMSCRAETGSPDPYQLGLYQSNSSGTYEIEVVSGATSAAFKIEDADVWRSGAYSCKAKTLFFDGSELETSSVDLSVIVLSPPVILNKATEQISVSLDSEAILECIAEGSPIPKITWTDNVGEIRDALDSVDGNTITSTLTIPGISEQQLGIYLCEASNSAGRDLHGIEVVELPPPEEPSALSDGAIAGIAVGVIVFITVIVIVGILCCCQPRSAKEGNPTGAADEENTKKILADEFTNVEDQGVENGAMPRSSPDGKDTSGEKVVETNVDETKKVEENANEIAMEPIYAKPDKTNSKKESSTADEETPPKSEGDN
ncbi:basement membrane-specific heparan sulfate proteoglycan core protein-like isoform X1 [Ptychodera flava]|uniref:basement membrane-specific heparan sulfate proteoglycan core protein-like isoform X1 n=1 Tax=Ptychodera flava TaxID=63121 RepID=UPI00396AA87D